MFELCALPSKSLLTVHPQVNKDRGRSQSLGFRKNFHPNPPKAAHHPVNIDKKDNAFGAANDASHFPHRQRQSFPPTTLDFKDDTIRIEAWGKQHFEAWMHSLTPQEIDVLKNYTSAHFFNLNCYLRGKKLFSKTEPLKKYDALSEVLSSILCRASIPSDVIVYRGISNQQILNLFKRLEAKDPTLLPGKILVDKAYMSTTLNESVGAKFSHNKQSDYLLRIMVPAGTPGAYMGNLSTYQCEAEILLEKGQILRIQGIQPMHYPLGSLYVLDCVLLGNINAIKKRSNDG